MTRTHNQNNPHEQPSPLPPQILQLVILILLTTLTLATEPLQKKPEYDPKTYHEEAHHNHPQGGSGPTHHYVVNNDNEHHKALYTQHHQHHQQPSATSRVLELSDRFLDIVNNVLPTQPGSTATPEEGPRYQPWLVKFYAPWCGHCKRLEPIFNHVAQALHNTPIRVGKVDCTRFPSVGSEYKIHGYPTIMFISGPTRTTFQGDREVSQIIHFAKRMSSPPLTKSPIPIKKFLTQQQTLNPPSPPSPDNPARTKRSEESNNPHSTTHHHANIINNNSPNNDNLYFGLIKPIGYKDKLTESFNAIATKYHQYNDFYEFQEESASTVTIFCAKSNRLVLFQDKQAEPPQVTIPTTTNITKNLESWIGTERFPDFIHLTRGNLYQIFSEPPSTRHSKDYIIAAVVQEDKLNRILHEDSKSFIKLLHQTTQNAITNSVISSDEVDYLKSNLGITVPMTTRSLDQYGWIGSPELANSIVAETLPLPTLLVIKKSTDPNYPSSHSYYVFSDYTKFNTEAKIDTVVQLVKEGHFKPYVEASSFSFRLYRYAFDAKVSLADMWVGNPVLTIVLFGLPLGFLSLILYSVCCGDIMDAKEEEFYEDGGGEDSEFEEEVGESHEKRE